jgi:dTDP-4-dehydrorhamnose reductase
MKKKIIILGASGQLGKEFKYNKEFIKSFSCSFYDRKEIDISKICELENIFKNECPHFVINCAAYTDVEKAESEKDKANSINNLSVKDLANLSKKYNFTIIHFSTDYVFSKLYGRPFTETDKKSPINIYGETKHLGEEQIVKFAEKFLIFRISWVYGEWGKNFPNTIISLSKSKKKIDVVSDQIGSPTSTLMIVCLIHKIISSPNLEKNYGIYNLTPSGQCSWFDISELIHKRLRSKKSCKLETISPVNSDAFETIAKRPSYSVLDNSLIKKTFNLDIKDWSFYLNHFLDKVDEQYHDK